MKEPPIDCTASNIVYQGYFNLRTDQIKRKDGKLLNYTSVDISWNAAVVVAEDQKGRLILNREYRHPTGTYLLGCPGGSLEKDEDPLEGGLRELFEETGYWSDELHLLGKCYPIPSICNQIIYFIYAKNAYLKASKQLDPFEFIETELKSEQELHQEIKQGALIDGILCTALWYKSRFAC